MTNKMGKSVLKSKTLKQKIAYRRPFRGTKKYRIFPLTDDESNKLHAIHGRKEFMPSQDSMYWNGTQTWKNMLLMKKWDYKKYGGYQKFLIVPVKGYLIYDSVSPWSDKKWKFYVNYSSIKGWTKGLEGFRRKVCVLPEEFKPLRWTKLFKAIIRHRRTDVLNLTPKELIELNRALQFRTSFNVFDKKHKPFYEKVNLKDAKEVKELLYGYDKIV